MRGEGKELSPCSVKLSGTNQTQPVFGLGWNKRTQNCMETFDVYISSEQEKDSEEMNERLGDRTTSRRSERYGERGGEKKRERETRKGGGRAGEGERYIYI